MSVLYKMYHLVNSINIVKLHILIIVTQESRVIHKTAIKKINFSLNNIHTNYENFLTLGVSNEL